TYTSMANPDRTPRRRRTSCTTCPSTGWRTRSNRSWPISRAVKGCPKREENYLESCPCAAGAKSSKPRPAAKNRGFEDSAPVTQSVRASAETYHRGGRDGTVGVKLHSSCA